MLDSLFPQKKTFLLKISTENVKCLQNNQKNGNWIKTVARNIKKNPLGIPPLNIQIVCHHSKTIHFLKTFGVKCY